MSELTLVRKIWMFPINFDWEISCALLVDWRYRRVFPTNHLPSNHGMENIMPTWKQSTNPIRIRELQSKNICIMINHFLLDNFERKLIILISFNKFKKWLRCFKIEIWWLLSLFYVFRKLSFCCITTNLITYFQFSEHLLYIIKLFLILN